MVVRGGLPTPAVGTLFYLQDARIGKQFTKFPASLAAHRELSRLGGQNRAAYREARGD